MADVRDIDKPGGWLVRVTTPGNPQIVQDYKVYELDLGRALTLVRQAAQVSNSESCEAIEQLNLREFTGDAMQPGQVSLHG
jgi:hypothetical protein